MKARPHLGLATAVVLILVSCGSGAEPKGPSQTDVWADLSRRVAREGSSADLALEAFSLAFGSLPGVDVPATSGPSLRSGSGAVRLVLRHFQEFSTAPGGDRPPHTRGPNQPLPTDWTPIADPLASRYLGCPPNEPERR